MRRILYALALTAAACDCGTHSKTLVPTLQVLEKDGMTARTSVDFGLVQVGVVGVQKVHVRNDGTATLTISDVTSTEMHFGVKTTLPFDLDPAGEGDLELTFTPDTPDVRVTGTMTLTSNDPQAMTYDLMVAGQGVTAVARTSPNPLEFGDVYVSEMKQVMLTLTNAGGNDLPVMGAKLTGMPAGVTADFSMLTNATVPAGMSVSVPVTFAPTMPGDVTGAVEIDIDMMYGGNVTVPLHGHGTQAVPQLCFKFDDETMPRCTGMMASLDVPFGALCDNTVTTCSGTSGQRSGQLYISNSGNDPVKYSVRYTPYPYSSPRCDAGLPPESDFVFDNVMVPDGGVPMPLDAPTTQLPMAVTDPMPWQTTPIHVTYRATSRCPSEGADQATVIWTRQDPIGVNHPPQTLIMTLNGTSLLPAAKPVAVNIGSQSFASTAPVIQPVELVTNEGPGSLTLNAVSLFDEVGCALSDGGMTDGGCLNACATSMSANCKGFGWVDGGAPVFPVWLDGGVPTPTKQVLGQLWVGCPAAGDPSCPTTVTHLRVIAVVNTSDPYAAQVQVPLNAWVQP
jgi:hypothetical protein